MNSHAIFIFLAVLIIVPSNWFETSVCCGVEGTARAKLMFPAYLTADVYTGVLISPRPNQEGNKLMFLSEWREFPSAPCLAGKQKKNLMTARVSMLKSRASLTCFRACFLPGRAKDLSAPRYMRSCYYAVPDLRTNVATCEDILSCLPFAKMTGTFIVTLAHICSVFKIELASETSV